jgi:hypothetical protein
VIKRGPGHRPPPQEQHERMVAAGERWVQRWVRGAVGEQMAAVRAFMAGERQQQWLHCWMRSRKGISIHHRNWGAMTLNLLLGVEPGVLSWVSRIYSGFVRQSDVGQRDGRVAIQLEGFMFCPRLATHELTSTSMRTAPAGSAAPASYDPYSPQFLPTSYRIQERLVHDPERFTYGSLEPGRAAPTTHIEFSANLSAHDQLCAQGDVQLVYSEDSHTVDVQERLARLKAFARSPPDLAEIERRCFGFEPSESGVQRVRCSVSEEAITAAMRRTCRESPGHNLGTELTASLGVAVRMGGRHRTFNPTTCPLWVGPPRRVDLRSGAIVGWPANLVHGWPNTNALSSAYHLSKPLCFASSFQPTQDRRHPQDIVWTYCWGISDWSDVLRPALARPLPPTELEEPKPPTRKRRCPSRETPPPASPTAAPAAAPTTSPAAASHKRTHREARSYPAMDPLMRTASDMTHHSTRLDSYSNNQAFAFMFTYVPDARRFFSVPHQLARALVFRFPEVYPPETTDLHALATRLFEEKFRFKAPRHVEKMLRALWKMFAPMHAL